MSYKRMDWQSAHTALKPLGIEVAKINEAIKELLEVLRKEGKENPWALICANNFERLAEKLFPSVLTERVIGEKSVPEREPTPEAPPSTEILVDLENGGLPAGILPCEAFMNTRRHIYGLNSSLVHTIRVYYCTRAGFTERFLSSFRDVDGLQLVEVPPNSAGKGDDADLKLKYDMLFHELAHPPPAPLCLISSDKDYVETIKKMMDNNYEILLGHDPSNSSSEVTNVAVAYKFPFPTVYRTVLPAGAMPPNLGVSPPRRALPPLPLEKTNLKLKVLFDVASTLDDDKRKKKLKVFPTGLTPKVIRFVTERLITDEGYGGICGRIISIALAETLNKKMKQEMEGSDFDVSSLYPPSKSKKAGQEYTDVRIGQLMQSSSLDLEHLVPLVLISSDPNLIMVVEEIVSMGFLVYLVHRETAPTELVNAATRSWVLEHLASNT
ncbi:unnamed protein product [Arabis nemorensis]|uniref:Uncharacterized protein n=1 Tax=Arabis nemorensis TaxID=586526 RepID=A0A565CUJ1_9BRAS|nr:unnamed protein product [Arabis nemorensis]